jgi:hypothetical protein
MTDIHDPRQIMHPKQPTERRDVRRPYPTVLEHDLHPLELRRRRGRHRPGVVRVWEVQCPAELRPPGGRDEPDGEVGERGEGGFEQAQDDGHRALVCAGFDAQSCRCWEDALGDVWQLYTTSINTSRSEEVNIRLRQLGAQE